MKEKLIHFLWRRRTALLSFGPVFMLVFARPSARLWFAALPLVILGEIIRFWSAGHLRKNEQVITSGPFGHVRNPLYIGSFLIFCGVCIMMNRWDIVWIFLALFVAFHTGATLFEEKHLAGVFGPAFDQYCRNVPRFFPRIKSIGGEGRYSFTLACRNREPVSATSTAIVVALFGMRALFPKLDFISALIHKVIG